MTVDEIRAELAALEVRLAPLLEEKAILRDRLLIKLSPFWRGDIITWDKGKYSGRVLRLGWWIDDEEVKYLCRRINKTTGQESEIDVWVGPYHYPVKL